MIVQGQKPNQLVFYQPGINSAEKRVLTIVVEYFEIAWQDLCIYDVSCGKTVKEFVDPKTNFDPTSGNK